MLYSLLAVICSSLDQLTTSLILGYMHPLLSGLFFSFILSTVCFIYIKKNGFKLCISINDNKKAFIVFLISITLSNITWYYSVFFLGISSTAALLVLSRVFVVLYGVVIFKDILLKKQLFGIFLTFAAMYLFVTFDKGEKNNILGYVISFISSVAVAVSFISLKYLSKNTASHHIIFWRAICSFTMFVIIIISLNGKIDLFLNYQPKLLFMFAFATACNALVYVFRLKSMQQINISTFITIAGLEPFVIYILGLTVTDTQMSLYKSIYGALMIFGAYLSINKQPQKP